MTIFNMVGGGSGGGTSYKTREELTAMSTSDALAELNTDAAGYYNLFSGNLRLYNNGIANEAGNALYNFGEGFLVYSGGTWATESAEYIEIKMKADSNGDLKIPIAGYSDSSSRNSAYNWQVSVDGGAATQYSGTGSVSAITVSSGLTADSEHIIKITPTNVGYFWARAFGFSGSGVETLLTEVIYDGSYMGYGKSATDAGNSFRRNQYHGCTLLTSAPEEVLPTTVTKVATYFRYYQYLNCSGLTDAPKEVCPDSITVISAGYFRAGQYSGCTSLKAPALETLSNKITNTYSGFRDSQYYKCTSLTYAAPEVLPSGVTTVGNNFRNGQYRRCNNIKTAELVAKFSSQPANYYRTGSFQNITGSTVSIRIVGDIVEYTSLNSLGLANANVSEVKVKSDLISGYQSSSQRSNVADEKFVADPSQ